MFSDEMSKLYTYFISKNFNFLSMEIHMVTPKMFGLFRPGQDEVFSYDKITFL